MSADGKIVRVRIDSLEGLTHEVRAFAAAREWERFHTPKNLAMALAVEAAELMEHFQWRDADEILPEDRRTEVAHEIADVLIYLIRLADVLGVDPVAAAKEKMVLNGRKYPVESARGNANKYDRLDAGEEG